MTRGFGAELHELLVHRRHVSGAFLQFSAEDVTRGAEWLHCFHVRLSKCIVSHEVRGIISCLSCCLCVVLADGGHKWAKGHVDFYESWHFLCRVTYTYGEHVRVMQPYRHTYIEIITIKYVRKQYLQCFWWAFFVMTPNPAILWDIKLMLFCHTGSFACAQGLLYQTE